MFSKYKLWFDCCDRHQLDQTSTLGGRSLVEISTKLRHPQCRKLDQTSTTLRPNFDAPSVEVWSKFARYINEIHSKLDKHVYQTATPNFDQTSTLGGSKFGRKFDQTSTPHRSK